MDSSSTDNRYRPTRVNITFGIFGTLAVAIVALLFLWSDTAPARYAVMPCQYNAIFETAGPVGAVILGSSRAQHGVSPKILSADLTGAGLPDNVISLARGNRGPEQLYQMLLDVDHQRGLQGPIIFEYSPEDGAFFQESPLYYWYYGGYGANAEFSTFAVDWQAKPREPAYSRLRDLLGHFEYRLDAAIENSTNGKSGRNHEVAVAARNQRRVVWCLVGGLVGQTDGQRSQIRRVYNNAVATYGADPMPSDIPPMRNDMKSINQDAQNHYLDLIISLAIRRGVPVYAITIPGFLEPAPSPATLVEFKKRFGIPLLFPDPKALEAYGDPALFMDAFHLNEAGNKVYTDWLAGIITHAPAQ